MELKLTHPISVQKIGIFSHGGESSNGREQFDIIQY